MVLALIIALHAKIRTLNFIFSIDSNSVKEELPCSYLLRPPLSCPSPHPSFTPPLPSPPLSPLPPSPHLPFLISLSPFPPPFPPPPPHSSILVWCEASSLHWQHTRCVTDETAAQEMWSETDCEHGLKEEGQTAGSEWTRRLPPHGLLQGNLHICVDNGLLDKGVVLWWYIPAFDC